MLSGKICHILGCVSNLGTCRTANQKPHGLPSFPKLQNMIPVEPQASTNALSADTVKGSNSPRAPKEPRHAEEGHGTTTVSSAKAPGQRHHQRLERLSCQRRLEACDSGMFRKSWAPQSRLFSEDWAQDYPRNIRKNTDSQCSCPGLRVISLCLTSPCSTVPMLKTWDLNGFTCMIWMMNDIIYTCIPAVNKNGSMGGCPKRIRQTSDGANHDCGFWEAWDAMKGTPACWQDCAVANFLALRVWIKTHHSVTGTTPTTI